MTEGQRERVLRALLGDDVPKMDEQTRKTLEGIAAEHLLAIEPVIDEIIQESIGHFIDTVQNVKRRSHQTLESPNV